MSGLVLLDTSVALHFVRGNVIAQRIDAALNLRARSDRPLISIITIGEALGFTRQRGWGKDKMDRRSALFEQLVIIDVNDKTVLPSYAAMHAYLVWKGRAVSDNDLWIAACAKAASATLITLDKDFDPLDGEFLQRIYFDPKG